MAATSCSPPGMGSSRCSARRWPTRIIRSARFTRHCACRRRCAVTPSGCARSGASTCRYGSGSTPVVVRNIQTGGGHTEYTPIGHSTGLAARLQTLANPGAVVISESVRGLAEGYFQLKPLGAARIKGVNEPIELFEVTGLGPLRTRLQAAARRGLTKFVGRQAELEQMRRALELARGGHGQ